MFSRYPRIPGPRINVGEIVPGLYQHSLRSTSVFIVATPPEQSDGADTAAGPGAERPEVTLIDAGWRIHSGGIMAHLARMGYGADSVKRLIATHYHLDHIGGMAGLQAMTGVPVEAHRVEAARLQQERRGDIPNPVQQWWLRALLWPLLAALHPPPIAKVQPLDEGTTLPLLGGARVIHTPGHTPGSISLLFPNEGVLIAADAMQRRGDRVTLPSPFFSSDFSAARESVQKLAELDFDVLCLSHFLPMRKGARSAVRSLAEYVS